MSVYIFGPRSAIFLSSELGCSELLFIVIVIIVGVVIGSTSSGIGGRTWWRWGSDEVWACTDRMRVGGQSLQHRSLVRQRRPNCKRIQRQQIHHGLLIEDGGKGKEEGNKTRLRLAIELVA